MAEHRELVIPTTLRDDETFLQDLARFVQATSEFKQTIHNRVSIVPPYSGFSDAEAAQISYEFEYDYEEAQRTISVFTLIKQQLLEMELSSEDAVNDIKSLLGDRVAEENLQELLALLSPSEYERLEYSGLRALSSGPTYLSSSLKPSLVSVESESELIGVHFMTLSYLNTEGEQRSVTIGFTPGELEQLESDIGKAKRRLESMTKIAWGEKNEGQSS